MDGTAGVLLLVVLLAVALSGAAAGSASAATEAGDVVLFLRVQSATGEATPVVLVVSGEEGEAVQRVDTAAPGEVRIVPAGAGPWTLTVEAEGFWSAPQVATGAPGEIVRIDMWPETRILGEIRVPEGHEKPPGVSLRIHREAAPKGRPPLDATVLCPLADDGRLDCRMPAAGDLDVRLRVPGFASRFFWDLDLTGPEVHDLGTVILRPGASVVGRVEVPAGHDLAKVVARLSPVGGAAASTAELERADRHVGQEVGVDERGLFSLEGLTAGAYRLTVSHPKLASYELNPLQVVEGSQSEVAETIVLREPIPLRLVLDPPFDPYGGDWRIEVFRPLPSGQKTRLLGDRELTATAGALDLPVAPGPYQVRIHDSHGERLATEDVVADGTGAPLLLTVEPVLVDGRVSLGEEPLLARVTFRAPHTVEMDSDLDGRFSGYLPRAGEWDVAVKALEPPIEWRQRGVAVEVDDEDDRAHLHLRLPDTALEGQVVDEQGAPVSGADVTVVDPLMTRPEVHVSSDEDGRFLLRGIDERPVQAQALVEGGDGTVLSSRPEIAHLAEEERAEVRLVLRPHGTLRARLVATDGNPVANASIAISPFDAAGVLDVPGAQPRSSDAAGRFEISLPRSIEVVHLLVMAPGHPLTTWTLPLDDAGDLVLGSEAGVLRLDLPASVEAVPWFDPPRPRPGLVSPQGVKYPLGLLAQWASLNGSPWEDTASQVEIPMLTPGRYAVCWVEQAVWLLRSAQADDCVATAVRAGEVVGLRLQSPPAAR